MSKKSSQLLELSNLKSTLFNIPATFVFNKNKKITYENLYKLIKKKIKFKNLAIRSDASSEDNFDKSGAGLFYSELNVNIDDKYSVIRAIKRVKKSYISKEDKINCSFIVQKMLNNVDTSGVIFTYNLKNSSPYFVINYDDISGKTNTVTSGSTTLSNKSLYIFHKGINHVKSKRFRNILTVISYLQKNIDFKNQDIEFAIDKKQRIFILQLRPITTIKYLDKEKLKKFYKYIFEIDSLIKFKINSKNIKTLGKKGIYGIMSDWNPAEMIGKKPKPLAISLYSKFITNHAWARSRYNLGYRFCSNQKLLVVFKNHPYIDIRLSFNSFIPSKINKTLANKLVNIWINELSNKPQYHDKIEFEIAITCYDFSLRNNLKKYKKFFSKTEIEKIYEIYFEHFFNLFSNSSCIFKKNNSKLEKLNEYINNISNHKIGSQLIKDNTKNLIEYGTIPFSEYARLAFISVSLLKSLVKKRIINQSEMNTIIESCDTITTEFVNDLNKYNNKIIKLSKLITKYGHLRPGTYDINSNNYEYFFKDKNFINENIKVKNKINIKKSTIKKIDNFLNKNYKSINAEDLISFITSSIRGREYGKYVFTKSINFFLEKTKNEFLSIFSTDELSYLKYEEIIRLFDENEKILGKFKNTIARRKNDKLITDLIELPQLITKKTDAMVVPYQSNQPNFITQKIIIGSLEELKNNYKNLSDKIIAIVGADPGYDWLFSKNIKGLITKYGGINSHMAIRCAEFQIPAAIGCGENLFNKILKMNKIKLDCLNNIIVEI